MKLEFFTIPALSPQAAVDELNRFLDAHRVSHIERQFVADGASSYWSVCVTWIGGDTPVAFDAAARRGRVDYREVLGAEEFAVYDRLRTLRKRLAEADGLPPFAVFTNEQLAAMVRQRVATVAALKSIEGVGDARLAKYGDAFLEILCEAVPRLGPAEAAGAN
ncbi:MAG: HRDC domain-containing protein [Rhodocyclaceae bacterium]|nr:HRDC domain-containing protein [Rhodocyclaceae bacterium]